MLQAQEECNIFAPLYNSLKKAEPLKREENVPRCDNAARFFVFNKVFLQLQKWHYSNLARMCCIYFCVKKL